MKVMLLGSKGQVGCLLKEKLLSDVDVDLISLTRSDLDITSREKVFEIIGDCRPDVIINAAAYTSVDTAEGEIGVSYAVNSHGPAVIAQAANLFGAVLLHMSTDYVFSGEKEGLYVETDCAAPQSVYGDSKFSGELLVSNHCKRHIILRTSWVFGEFGTNFVKTMLKLGKNRDSLSIVCDQVGGPTYAGDIADALIKITKSVKDAEESIWGVYHFSGYPHVSWEQFADEIFISALSNKVLKTRPEINGINTHEYPTAAKRPKNSKLNCNKIKAQFNICESDWKLALKNIGSYK